MEHSKFSPSSAHIWSKCPGYVRQMENRKKTTSAAATEGRAAHWVAERALQETPILTGTITPQNIAVTEEMVEGARLFYGAIKNYGSPIYTEQLVNIPYVHPECFGTVDAYSIIEETLQVWDYKFGWGIVDVVNNLQLILYATGAMNAHYPRKITCIKIGIVQPRPYHRDGAVRQWTVPSKRFKVILEKLRIAAGDTQLTTGKHCRYCEAKLNCPSYSMLTRAMLDEYSIGYAEETPTPDILGKELMALKSIEEVLKNRIVALETELIQRLKNGQQINGWSLIQGRGNYTWNTNIDTLHILGRLLNINLTQEKPITPRQAEKKGVNWSLIEKYVKKESKTILKSYDPDEGRKIFGEK